MDLNCDMGESFGAWRMGEDAAMLDIVSSANIACGFHAGDPAGILATLRQAVARGIRIGAHPGYPDLAGFGRRAMDMASPDLIAGLVYQIGALEALARLAGGRVAYVKPHGALYNTAAQGGAQGDAVITALLAHTPRLPLMMLAGSPLLAQARVAGLPVIAEAFADRAYLPDGQLVPRNLPGAVLHDPDLIAARMLRLAREGVIEARDGSLIALEAQSICVHGDSPGAVAIASRIRAQFKAEGVPLGPDPA
ncbi:LamB/YcsF family protein [Gemmobacter serpentinus]|uniref:LamB/YcsF family protein n=1 Tax=Gemmobacter serpentinus TaxID=2652247 RepID=UPI001CF709D6|nr:5-oxoprolinase subunit PxpA [Gemmobacter serpentinus]